VNKDVFDKTASELAKVKKQLKELQEKSMTDEEKLQAELEKAIESQKQYAKELAKLRAKEIFVEAGLTESDYSSILDVVVSEDEETTKTRAKSLVDLISAQKAAVEKAVKVELLKGTPKPPAGTGGDTDEAFEKEIEAARANGDMATVAALIRQRAMSEKK
jgi:alanyl-tRNA synthetase